MLVYKECVDLCGGKTTGMLRERGGERFYVDADQIFSGLHLLTLSTALVWQNSVSVIKIVFLQP